ncbi:MAG: hypothetical protein R3F14_01445 [Polyangiaceae bacterium]
MAISPEQWESVLLQLPREKPALAEQYVLPPAGCAAEIERHIRRNAREMPKVLLVGARGGGKSSEMRQIERLLQKTGSFAIASIDLDATGLHPGNLTAFDLLYVSCLSLLRGIPDKAEAERLYDALAAAYAGDKKSTLGTMTESVQGLADFADSAAIVATMIGAGAKLAGVDIDPTAALAGGGVSVAGRVYKALKGIVLREDRPGVVAESSPLGRGLLGVAVTIARARRVAEENKPVCVLIDGMEKMNGEATERFRQIFEQTRLLSEPPWCAVISSPPCTLAETNAAHANGFHVSPVWGFDPVDTSAAVELVKKRFQSAMVDPEEAVAPEALEEMARWSGGLPRDLVNIAHDAIDIAAVESAPKLGIDHVRRAVERVSLPVRLGITDADLVVLRHVHEQHKLPGDDRGARLFGDGRILVRPPERDGDLPRFDVHPFLVRAVDRFAAQQAYAAAPG